MGSKLGLSRQLSGTLIVACRSTSAKPSYDFNEFLLRLVSMLDLHLFRLVKAAKFGELLNGLDSAFPGLPKSRIKAEGLRRANRYLGKI